MAGQKFTLTFDANLNVSQMKGALNQIQSSLNGLHLPQNIAKGLQSTFANLEKEIQNFENLTSKGITKASDMSALEKSSEKILNFYNLLQIKIKDLGNLAGKDLNKLFPQQVVDQINAGLNALKQYETEIKNIQDKVNKSKNNVDTRKNELNVLSQQRQQMELTLQTLKKQEESYRNLGNKATEVLNNLQAKAQSLQQIMANAGVRKNVAQSINDYSELEKALEQARLKLEQYYDKVQNGRKPNLLTETGLKNRVAELEAAQAAWNKQASAINYAENAVQKYTTKAQSAGDAIKTMTSDLTKLEGKINTASTNLKVAEAAFKQIKTAAGTDATTAINNFFNTLQKAGFNIQGYGRTVDEAKRALKDFENAQRQVAVNGVQKVLAELQAQSGVLRNNKNDVDKCTESWRQYINRAQEVDTLKSRIQYFFGLNNAINLVKRTMREAYETIKELDKAMTETAVVTDFSVGDMWAQLPEYTKRANELGVSTKAAYEAATLYYQQGLKTNEVMAMSNETLKMARIAGLDAAVATDRMTNAIRGFNMEINTTNAQRIDDVYSKLAAISASNVDEISTAMTKVASLAHSANMEFETTAAFLAQIIETTRESAETAGTALKTVVARFSEVKKLVSEGALSGTDEEGEGIDVNKVSSALRVAGIDLNKYFLGEVGLDDIFMELASKWKSLTQLQQRFIATQAAGSRQQSRFIALMSDYARTQELVGEAYNANGAAAKQFAKTQESLESKLARLKNAWNEFAMGVLNSDIIKWGVDRLTDILNGINALTSGFGTLNSGAGKFLNTFAKLTLLMGSLRVGKGLTGGLLSSIGAMVDGNYEKGMFQQYVAKTLEVDPGKNLFSTLGKGLTNQFGGIGKGIGVGAKALWGGATKLGTSLYGGSISASQMAASGGMAGLVGHVGLTGTAVGIAGIATALTAVTVAAGVTYLAIKKVYDASPAGQVKIAEKYAESMQQAANTAKQTAADFEKVQQEYSALDNTVSNASNLEEKTEAIKSRSEYVKSLIEQNSVYAQYLQDTKFENGEFYLTLDSKKLEEACTNIAKAAVEAAAANNLAQSNLAYQEYEKYQAEFEKEQERKTKIQDPSDPAARLRYGEWTKVDEQYLIDLQARMQEKLAESTNYAMQTASNYIDTSELSDTAASYLVSAIGEGLSSDAVSKKIKEEKKKISGDIDEQYYIAFGNLGEGLTKETKKLALAVKNANLSLVEGFKPFISTFEQLPEEAQKVLYEFSSNNGYGLTRDEYFKAIQTSPEQWFIDSKGNNILDLIPNEEIRQEILNAFKAGLSQENPFDILSKSISEIFQDSQQSKALLETFESITKDLTAEQASVFPRLFKEFMTYGQGSIEDFTTFLTKLIDSIPKNKLNDLFNLLGSLNFQDSGNLKVFLESLEDLNPNWDAMGRSAESAAEALKKFTNSVEEFNMDDFRNEIVDNVSLMRDIKGRKPKSAGYRVFNQDERDLLVSQGVSEYAFEFSGIKNKEYTYTGESLDLLVEALIDGLTQKANEAWLKKQEQIEQGQYIATFGQSVIDQLAEIINSGELTQEQVNNTDWIQEIITKFRGEEALGLPANELLEILKQAFQWYRDLEVNKTAQETIQREAYSPMNYITPINEFKNEIDSKEYSNAVTSKFYVDEHAEDRYESILESIQQIDAANASWNKTSQEQETISRALAVNWSEEASNLAELTEVLDKNDKILYEGSKDSYEYSGAIHAVGEAMREAYGQQVSDEFVQAHIQQIVMARESKEAYQELLDLLQQDFFSNAKAGVDDLGNSLDANRAILNGVIADMYALGDTAYSLDGLEINGVAVLDGTPWMTIIGQLIKAGYDVAAFFDTLGWTVVYGPKDINGIPSSVQLVRNQPTGYGGYQPYTGNNWGRGSSGGGGSSPKEKEPKKEEWRSDFDWLYNLMEDITELQREQTKLQEEQNKILELGNDSDTGKDLYENLVKQMANLLTQKSYQQFAKDHRSQEMQEFMAVNAGYGGYFRFNDLDQTLEINWDAINNIGNKETYEKVKDLVSQAESIQKKMDESDDALRDIETQIRQLEDIWREQYVDFEKRVLDALVKSYQRVIDNYSDLNDTVTKGNEEILNAIQEEIALERQIRDNTKTEDEISDAEARLAFLRRDTTGGNQVEILNAQQQLDEMRQSYSDQLIDQSVSRLQDDNAKAAEQRERQIELMQAQLDYAVENGELNGEVRELIINALGADGELLTNSDLVSLLQQEESWAAMSATNKELWEDELNNTFKEVSAYLLKEQGEIDGTYLQDVAAAINDNVWASANVVGDQLEVGLGSMGQSIGLAIGSMSQAWDHVTYTYDDAINGLREANAGLANMQAENSALRSALNQANQQNYGAANAGVNRSAMGSPTAGNKNMGGSGQDYHITQEEMERLQKREKRLQRVTGFATGGLTTRTGPAWLDGTTAEPEYVLNARQTEAFLKLADVLPSMFNGVSTTTNNVGGTMYLNFDISVDSISNDYDVDQLVERVKDDIYNAASYRNANVISFSR